ncbi:uncharacterized protein LOC105181076 [Harpegnathos saltator]|uniref:uncharacterized protein LOC105181076 n=1 Tax=Harpegnathos saltator TaxID=610380 RepID=UPI00058DB2E9|nr:uncharacterized protein LOC105181076 [Harpegnathos saltator]
MEPGKEEEAAALPAEHEIGTRPRPTPSKQQRTWVLAELVARQRRTGATTETRREAKEMARSVKEPEPDWAVGKRRLDEDAWAAVEAEDIAAAEDRARARVRALEAARPRTPRWVATWAPKKCWRCEGVGHTIAQCPSPQHTETRCYRCQRPGYTMKTCPGCSQIWQLIARRDRDLK